MTDFLVKSLFCPGVQVDICRSVLCLGNNVVLVKKHASHSYLQSHIVFGLQCKSFYYHYYYYYYDYHYDYYS